ncbi:MAG: helix-turn-helix transcriptional regulator [Planctomycetes bacterium]|nr:helix-turn-helix transcriptional regulator [Planctomycetota bacterium]
MASISQPQKNKAVSTFVAEIRKRLAAKGMTISELAEEAEVGRPYVHRVLAGEQTPTVEWMEKVGKILGISIKVTVK